MYFLFKIDLNIINEYFEISGKMKKKKLKFISGICIFTMNNCQKL